MKQAKRRDRIIRFFCLSGFLLAIPGARYFLDWLYQLQNPQTPDEFMTAGAIKVVAAAVWSVLNVLGWTWFYARLYDRLVAPLLRPTEIVWEVEDLATPEIIRLDKGTQIIFKELQRQQLDGDQRTLIKPSNEGEQKP